MARCSTPYYAQKNAREVNPGVKVNLWLENPRVNLSMEQSAISVFQRIWIFSFPWRLLHFACLQNFTSNFSFYFNYKPFLSQTDSLLASCVC